MVFSSYMTLHDYSIYYEEKLNTMQFTTFLNAKIKLYFLLYDSFLDLGVPVSISSCFLCIQHHPFYRPTITLATFFYNHDDHCLLLTNPIKHIIFNFVKKSISSYQLRYHQVLGHRDQTCSLYNQHLISNQHKFR